MKTKGFTLVELLVVIAILAILATVSVVGYTSFINRADESNALTEAHQIEEIIESALLVHTEAQVTDTIKVAKSGTTYTFSEAVTSVDGAYDLSDDLAGFSAKLVVNNGKLIYKYSATIHVDVMAGEVLETPLS